MAVERIRVIVEFVAKMPDDEDEADKASDAIGDRIQRIIETYATSPQTAQAYGYEGSEIAAGSVKVIDWTSQVYVP